MSYTYLQGPGEESSADNFSDIEPFVRSKLNLTAEKFCCNGNGTGSCLGFQSGMTCEHSTEDPGGESSMSCVAGSPARTSARPERVQESTANDPGYGAKWPESLAKYDPDSRLWKTRQCSFLEGLAEFSETFPKWGMTHGGELYRQPTPVLRTCGKGSGYWPTPRKSDGDGGGIANRPRHQMNLRDAVKAGNAFHSQPTATKTDSALFADSSTPKSANALAQQWTTTNTPSETESSSHGLLPTPKSRDWRGRTQRGIHGPMDSVANLDRGDGKPLGRQLNPDWVEWLMGWPIGWTVLKPLETDKYRQWLQSHGACFHNELANV